MSPSSERIALESIHSAGFDLRLLKGSTKVPFLVCCGHSHSQMKSTNFLRKFFPLPLVSTKLMHPFFWVTLPCMLTSFVCPAHA